VGVEAVLLGFFVPSCRATGLELADKFIAAAKFWPTNRVYRMHGCLVGAHDAAQFAQYSDILGKNGAVRLDSRAIA